MLELLQQALSLPNIFYTFLMCLCLVYFAVVMIGVIDLEAFDFDFDFDVGTDLDVDADLEVDGELATTETGVEGAAEGASALVTLLSFFNLGRVPFMIYFSLLSLSMWMLSISINYTFNFTGWLTTLLLFLPILFSGLFITKILTQPFVKIFDKLKGASAPIVLVGKICTIAIPTTTSRLGQAELYIDKAPYLINVKANKDALTKGQTALIIEHNKEKDFYIIEHYDPHELVLSIICTPTNILHSIT